MRSSTVPEIVTDLADPLMFSNPFPRHANSDGTLRCRSWSPSSL